MTTEAKLERTKVDLGGLLKVLSESLYSTPNVAIRELVQNAHDSCRRRQLETSDAFEPRIVVSTDSAKGTLAIEDNGAGLTHEEIDRYLATVGAGYTRLLRERGADVPLIGQFGLGFLSAFIISQRAEVWTTSYQEPERAWLFSSRSGESYMVTPAEPRAIGTRVLLKLSERFLELSNEQSVLRLLERYCCLLKFPVFCGDGPAVNDLPPPWHGEPKSSPLRKKTLALEFVERFERRFKPLCTIALEPDEKSGRLARGLLWIQDSATYGTSDNRNVSVFVRGMLVSDDERDLLPNWAGFVGVVLEGDGLSPTASRESLQKDEVFAAVARQVRDTLVEGLSRIACEEPATWRRILLRHNEALLGAALCDDRLFRLLCRDVTVPTSQGELTLPAILSRSDGKVHVSQAEGGGFEELLFRALKVPVVHGTRYAALPFCRMYTSEQSGRLVLFGTGKGDQELFSRAELTPSDTARLSEWFRASDTEVVPARFEPRHLPLVLVSDHEIVLKRRLESDEADRRLGSAVLAIARDFTRGVPERAEFRLYVNLACPAIGALLEAEDAARERGIRLLKSLVVLLCASGEETPAHDVDQALREQCAIIEEILRGH